MQIQETKGATREAVWVGGGEGYFFVCGRRVFVPTAIGRIGKFGYPTSGEACLFLNVVYLIEFEWREMSKRILRKTLRLAREGRRVV
jgi:hypothetical protein